MESVPGRTAGLRLTRRPTQTDVQKGDPDMGIRILLADDHTMLRHGLKRSIQQERDMEVIAEAADGRTAVRMAKELAPDVVVMDISMPDLNGVEATRSIAEANPDVRVVALSMHATNKYIAEMFRAGARAYVLKDCDFDELAHAVRTVMSGKTYVSPAVANVVVDNYLRPGEGDQGGAFSLLSRREREVLQLLAEGKSTKQIGAVLHISPKTVEAHRVRVMEKLDIDNVAQLTKYAIQEGLTSPEP
jgi:DNA-binding NarL/FixJ family response regulator